jgi:hypothetical protein
VTKARSNAVAEAAKGDLSVGTGTNLAGILAIGSNGETLVADSSTSTGLRYQATTAAGKNAIINGGFDVWQRGTSFSIPASNLGTFTADRFVGFRTSAGAGMTVSRQSAGLTGFNYCLRAQRNAGDTNTQGMYVLGNTIETVNSIPFQGKTVVFSFYARAGSNLSATGNSLTFTAISGTGTDQFGFGAFTGQSTIATTTVTLTTTWQRFTVSATVSSSATEISFYTITNDSAGTAGANDYYEVTGFQMELGSVATTFSRAGGTIQGELAACQRYYIRYASDGNINFDIIGPLGAAATTTLAYVSFINPTFRAAPTAVDYSNLRLSDNSGGTPAISNIVIATNSNQSTTLLEVTSSSLSAYRPYQLQANNNATAYLGLSAEL